MAVTQPLLTNISALRGGLPFLPFPAFVNHRTVTTAVDETVPAGAASVVIISDATIWCANGTGAAVVPSGNVTDGTGSFAVGTLLISPPFGVTAGQKLSVVSASGTAHVAFLYFAASPV